MDDSNGKGAYCFFSYIVHPYITIQLNDFALV